MRPTRCSRPGRDRGARLVAAFLYPVAHRTTLRVAVALGTRGLGAVEPAGLPDAAAVARGWQLQLDRGMRVVLPDDALQRAVDTARAAVVLAGQAWKVDPEVGRGARGLGSRRGGRRCVGASHRPGTATTPTPTRRVDVMGGRPCPRRADRRSLPRRGCRARVGARERRRVELLDDWPADWIGSTIDVRDAPTRRGPVSCSVRWHGDRPALLWDGPAGVQFRTPGLDPAWWVDDARGEVLLGRPAGARDRQARSSEW